MPSSVQYRTFCPPGAWGGPTTASGRTAEPHSPPPVSVTNPLPSPLRVWMTIELCTSPVECENPHEGVAGPR